MEEQIYQGHLSANYSNMSHLVGICTIKLLHRPTHIRIYDDGRIGRRRVSITEATSATLNNSFATRGSTACQYGVLDALQATPPLIVITVLLHQRRKTL